MHVSVELPQDRSTTASGRVKESEGLAHRSPFSTTTDTGPPAFVLAGRNWSALEKADSWAPPTRPIKLGNHWFTPKLVPTLDSKHQK